MSPIKDLNVTFETINGDSSYSEGDTIVGTVSFRLTKEVKVKSVSVKAKGDANVEWTEGGVPVETLQSAHRRYFKVKGYLIAENNKGTSLPKEVQTFNFRLKIPEENMPSSFQGKHGKITYTCEAKISRSWRLPSKVLKEINFVSKSCPPTGDAMCPLSDSVSKKMSGLSKGQVQMSATINRGVCFPGETLTVVAKICNSSSKSMRPKFKLEQRTVYRCKDNNKTTVETLFKMVGNSISRNSEQTASCRLKIPDDAIPTLHNCEIISVEYYIKVYLDISFAFDPEVVFPLVIVPSTFATIQPGEAVGLYRPGTAEPPTYSEFTSSAVPTGFDPAPTGSGTTPDPTQHSNITSGDYNQWPQGAASQGFSTPAFTSPSVPHPGPTALPHLLQGEQSPLYVSIYHHQNE